MSQPSDLGAISQLLRAVPLDQLRQVSGMPAALRWHDIYISPALRGAEAGRWAIETIQGSWTFTVDAGGVRFFIKDKSDAALFKLTWVGR